MLESIWLLIYSCLLVFYRTGALRSQNSGLLVEQGVEDTLPVFGECVARQGIGQEILTCAALFGGLQTAPDYLAAKCKHNLLFLRFGVNAHQPFDLHL